MKATQFEFRFRFLIHAILYALGIFAPWNLLLSLDSTTTWLFLAASAARAGLISFSAATAALLIAGIVLATAAALLRTWASAYLGPFVVQDGTLHGTTVTATGSYRYLRNPLYVGTYLHTLALVLLMSLSGAIFCILTIGLFQLRLIAAEEAFLTTHLGPPYAAYRSRVRSLFPSFAPTPATDPTPAASPHWGAAVAGEIYMWGAAASFAILGWRYNAFLVLQGVVVSLGISLLVRAFMPER